MKQPNIGSILDPWEELFKSELLYWKAYLKHFVMLVWNLFCPWALSVIFSFMFKQFSCELKSFSRRFSRLTYLSRLSREFPFPSEY